MGAAGSQIYNDVVKTVETCCLNKNSNRQRDGNLSPPNFEPPRSPSRSTRRDSSCSHMVDGSLVQPTDDEHILFSSVIAQASQCRSPGGGNEADVAAMMINEADVQGERTPEEEYEDQTRKHYEEQTRRHYDISTPRNARDNIHRRASIIRDANGDPINIDEGRHVSPQEQDAWLNVSPEKSSVAASQTPQSHTEHFPLSPAQSADTDRVGRWFDSRQSSPERDNTEPSLDIM